MSASIPSAALATAHRQFEDALPAMDRVIRFAFRHWSANRRHEAVADARSASWHAWHGLVRRGRDPLRVGPTGIAANACRYVRRGRKLGCGTVGRSAVDIYDPRALRWLGIELVHPDGDPDATPGGWRGWLATDRRYGPGDEAGFRIDFAAWLDRLPARKRAIVEGLAQGRTVVELARQMGVTPGAISQARAWLAVDWSHFLGEV